MRYRFEIIVDVDDERLEQHPGEQAPPPNDLLDWDFSDIVAAVKRGIIEPQNSEAKYVGDE